MNQLFHMVHFTPVSSNKKTGPIPVSTSAKQTCPDACPFKAGMCYAKSGPLNIHWTKISNGTMGIAWAEFVQKIKSLRIGTLWRHNQAGDFAGDNNTIDAEKMRELVAANRGKKVISYTHKPVLDSQGPEAKANRELIAEANKNGFTVNLSGNHPAHADKLFALGIAPVTTVVPIDQTKNFKTPAGNRVVICPAATREGVSCATCKLCSVSKRDYIIGFPAHGIRKKALNEFVSEGAAVNPLAA